MSTHEPTPNHAPLAYSPKGACAQLSCGLTFLYLEIAAGRIEARKAGSRRRGGAIVIKIVSAGKMRAHPILSIMVIALVILMLALFLGPTPAPGPTPCEREAAATLRALGRTDMAPAQYCAMVKTLREKGVR